MGKTYRVARPHKPSSPDSMVLTRGELVGLVAAAPGDRDGWIRCLSTRGESGWIPTSYVQSIGNLARACRDVEDGDFRAQPGQVLQVVRKEQGRYLCTASDGTQCWLPANAVEDLGEFGRVQREFDSTELWARPGEIVKPIIEEAGWAFCLDDDHRKGWVPLTHLEEATA